MTTMTVTGGGDVTRTHGEQGEGAGVISLIDELFKRQ